MNRRDIWLWLALATKGSATTARKLLSGLKNVEEIYYADEKKLIENCHLTQREINALIEEKKTFAAEREWEGLEKDGIKFVSCDDIEFPDKLKLYPDSPLYLFYKGTLPRECATSVAMVGARACSNYGRTMAKTISADLSASEVQIISGLARGIDTYCHLGAMQGGTPTFAVLGCGINICYPTENIKTYNEIILSGGGIISEYPPNTKPLGRYFPLRNRIISGLADKIVVVEARENSGSLITVEWALEQGKDIYAIPGRVGDPLSEGCNRIIKTGAGLLTGAKDILDELNYNSTPNVKNKKEVVKVEGEKMKIYNTLSMFPKSLQEIMNESGEPFENVTAILFELQMLGMVHEISKNYYVKT